MDITGWERRIELDSDEEQDHPMDDENPRVAQSTPEGQPDKNPQQVPPVQMSTEAENLHHLAALEGSPDQDGDVPMLTGAKPFWFEHDHGEFLIRHPSVTPLRRSAGHKRKRSKKDARTCRSRSRFVTPAGATGDLRNPFEMPNRYEFDGISPGQSLRVHHFEFAEPPAWIPADHRATPDMHRVLATEFLAPWMTEMTPMTRSSAH